MKTNYIGADVHCKMTELAVERNGKIVVRDRVPTDIRTLGRFLNSITGKKVMVNRIRFIADTYGITAEDLDEHHMYPCICGLQDLS